MADADEDERPDREPRPPPVLAPHGLAQVEQLVDVEGEAREVADEEDEDEAHEDGGQVVLEAAAALVLAKGLRSKRKEGGGLKV